MLGSFGVGKTSLVNQFVHSIFSEEYLTTIGARIERHELSLDEILLSLIIWDLAGEDKFDRVRSSYVGGAAGYVLVFDGMRRETVAEGVAICDQCVAQSPDTPVVCVMNKSDLFDSWTVGDEEYRQIADRGWPLLSATATDGASTARVFESLARHIVPTAPT